LARSKLHMSSSLQSAIGQQPNLAITSPTLVSKDILVQEAVCNRLITLNWQDALIWCNALTEWFNAQTGSHLHCVYKFHDKPIKDASGKNYMPFDTASPDTSANDFRLPTGNEWELASRYREDKNSDGDIPDPEEYYPGNFASGATTPWTDAAATALVAVYNTTGGTAEVKSKKPNALGIYDMSGNVSEWCFDWFPGYEGSSRLVRGGSWIAPADVQQLSYMLHHDPYTEYFLIGLRVVRNR
jgi:formylglycine-generating enzyme required for sulfatase activity